MGARKLSRRARRHTEPPVPTGQLGVMQPLDSVKGWEGMYRSGPSPSYCRLPRCRMEAKSFEISQFSVSVNMSTFMAERMLAYSWLSSRPSHVMQLPWWAGEGEQV